MKIKYLFIAVSLGIALAFSGCVEETNEAPEASFTYDPMENLYPDTEITFTDTSRFPEAISLEAADSFSNG